MNKLKDINWNQLYYFYEVARVGSLKEGAKSLGLASSTVSEQIKRLEKSFSKTFFQRSSKGLNLTADGRLLYDKSKKIFEEGNKLLELFSDNLLGGYTVKVGIDEALSFDLSNEFVSQYWDYYTMYGVVNTFKYSEHEALMKGLQEDHVDWGISVQRPRRSFVDYAEIGPFDLVFCCSKDLFQKFKDKKDLLLNIPFGENNSDKRLNKQIYKHLRKLGVTPKEKIVSDHPGLLNKLCKRGRCVICLPLNPLKSYEDLETFNIDQSLKIRMYVVWKKSSEKLISIIKLKELINSKLSNTPIRYEDVNLQIEASEVSKDLLKTGIKKGEN